MTLTSQVVHVLNILVTHRLKIVGLESLKFKFIGGNRQTFLSLISDPNMLPATHVLVLLPLIPFLVVLMEMGVRPLMPCPASQGASSEEGLLIKASGQGFAVLPPLSLSQWEVFHKPSVV